MPISANRKAQIRAEIVGHAARLFRLRGNAGTSIDDIMLASGLTRGSFYAHFESKDDLFAEILSMGHGILSSVRAAPLEQALDDYLDRDRLAANAQSCMLASLANDVARSTLPARLAYANVVHGLIAELARGRRRRLDADATSAAILTVGAVAIARASGDTRLADWILRCARRTTKSLLKPVKPSSRQPVSPRKKRSTSRPKAATARPAKRAAR